MLILAPSELLSIAASRNKTPSQREQDRAAGSVCQSDAALPEVLFARASCQR